MNLHQKLVLAIGLSQDRVEQCDRKGNAQQDIYNQISSMENEDLQIILSMETCTQLRPNFLRNPVGTNGLQSFYSM